MVFNELSNDEWARLASLLADEPTHPHRRGRPRAETRVVANAVLWILSTGARWSRLPARYPSGPTCRRRFDEWLANGALMQMVKALEEFGRAFAYIPHTQPSNAPTAPTLEPAPEAVRLRGVFWTNPESWRMPGATDTVACADRVSDPLPALSALPSTPGASLSAPRHPQAPCEIRSCGAPRLKFSAVDMRVNDYRGYTIYAAAQPVARMYRASVEIVKEGERIERSGLIGPRFSDRESAERHALEWGRAWVERYGVAMAASRDQFDTGALPAVERATLAPAALATPFAPMAVKTVPEHVFDAALTLDGHAAEWLTLADARADTKPVEFFYRAGVS